MCRVNSTIFVTIAVLVVFLVVWGLSIAMVWAAAGARRLPRAERLFWAALAAALPLVGALIYPLARMAGLITSLPRSSDSSLQRDTTAAQSGPASPFGPPPDLFAPAQPVSRRPSSPQPMAGGYGRLVVARGPSAGLVAQIGALPARIGRGEGAWLSLDADGKVSRQHAELFERGGAIFIRDLNSLHGTRVNGAVAREQRLSPGDTIRVGDSDIIAELVG